MEIIDRGAATLNRDSRTLGDECTSSDRTMRRPPSVLDLRRSVVAVAAAPGTAVVAAVGLRRLGLRRLRLRSRRRCRRAGLAALAGLLARERELALHDAALVVADLQALLEERDRVA